MGAATILPVVPVDDGDGSAVGRPSRRALEAHRADAARARRRRGARPSLYAGDGHLHLVPRFELVGEELVAHDDLAPLRRSPSAAPGRTARPVGPAAVVLPSSTRPAPVPAVAPTAATYRRRRLVAGALVLGVLLAGGWALGALGGGPLTASRARSPEATVTIADAQPVSRSTYVVQPGDTLWSIAHQLVQPGDEGADVRPVVDALAAERHGRPLEVGETIVLP